MENINQIRNRINKKESKSTLLSFLSLIMLLISFVLGGMIYMKKDENGTFLKENFGLNVNFKTFNNRVNIIINDLFKFEFEEKNVGNQLVSNPVNYIQLNDNMFSCEDTSISMLNDGVVLGVYEEGDNYTILINYDNGVLASYSSIQEVLVKEYDQLEKGDKFASYYDSFKVLFKKDGVLISYDEAIK